LLQVAADAKAPRPHRVFLSPAVNAAVFYDLTVFNLLFPSRKNLVIGLGLINVLNLSELKAVLAHEFGHFAQRSMAVGRWVYTAQQIAAHIVEKRDVLDRFLRGVSNFDLRVAWIGWILRTIVWAIRALVDTVFSIVILAERALSREMELQADLVAVSLTGSDPLIHALHRLGAADDALDRALAFTGGQQRAGKRVEDLFAIQTEMIARKRHILADPTWGEVPAPVGAASEQRLFKAQLAHPPQMWSTHPPSTVREDNAKRRYIAAPIDTRSAWTLFDDPARVRREVTAWLYRDEDKPSQPVPMAETMATLAKGFERRYLDPAYRGVYLGRSVVRAVARPAALFEAPGVPRDRDGLIAAIGALYPASLSAAIERGRRARDRGGDAAGDRARRRRGPGRRGPPPRPGVPAPGSADLDRAGRARAEGGAGGRDRSRPPGAHRSPGGGELARRRLGRPPARPGRSAALRRSQRRQPDDAMGVLQNTVAVALADRSVSSDEVQRMVAAGGEVHHALMAVYASAGEVVLGPSLLGRLEVPSWAEGLGRFDLARPTPRTSGRGSTRSGRGSTARSARSRRCATTSSRSCWPPRRRSGWRWRRARPAAAGAGADAGAAQLPDAHDRPRAAAPDSPRLVGSLPDRRRRRPDAPAAGGRRQHRRQRDLGVAVARRGATARRRSVPTRHDRHGFLRGAAGKAASRLARPLGTAHAWQMGMRMRTRTGFVALMALWIAAGCAPELYGDDDDGSGLPCGGIAGGTCEGDEFCDYPVEHACGITDGGGVCRARPTACPEIYAPVIGSDGVRYDNACFAHAAGADDCGPAATP
jgi:Zn-dependent protease with chaperone function